jgi:hypothetical protein
MRCRARGSSIGSAPLEIPMLPPSIGSAAASAADSNRGDRDDDAGRDERRRRAADQPRRRAVARRIEHRQQPAFQLPPARHRDCRLLRVARAAAAVGDFQQVVGVAIGFGAEREDAIVAGELALHLQAASRPPDAGMRPVPPVRARPASA